MQYEVNLGIPNQKKDIEKEHDIVQEPTFVNRLFALNLLPETNNPFILHNF